MRHALVGRGAGIAAMIGGVLGLLVAPLMVIVKYQTGWSIVPEPSWVQAAESWLGTMFVLVVPGAVLASLTILPTSPSGGLWVFSMTMIALGGLLATHRWPVSTPCTTSPREYRSPAGR